MFSVVPTPSSVLKKCNNLQPDEVILTPLYVSVDPYLFRLLLTVWKQVPFSQAVVKVLASRCKEYPSEQLYLAREFPWASVHVATKTELDQLVKSGKMMLIPKESPPYDKFSPSEYLGALGLTGQTAYYGLLTVGAFKDGESLFVSGAAGATGSMVGQIAKLKRKNTYVVGCAGGAEKVKWLVNDLKFDKAIDYKKFGNDSNAMQKELRKLFPKGIDVYFDNTGGLVTECVWDLLNENARVLICGQIASYGKIQFTNTDTNTSSVKKINDFLFKLIYKKIRVEGFLVYSCNDWVSFYRDMKEWMSNGQIKAQETLHRGFEKIPAAFEGLFTGANLGKTVIQTLPSDLKYTTKSKY